MNPEEKTYHDRWRKNLIRAKIFVALAFALSLSTATDLNISGVVRDGSGAGIAGAVVKLNLRGYSTITGIDGNFALVKSPVIRHRNFGIADQFQPYIVNGGLRLVTIERKEVYITVFDIRGTVMWKTQKTVDAGVHFVNLPVMAGGVYIYKITAGVKEFVLSGTSFGQNINRLVPGSVTANSPSILSKSEADSPTVVIITEKDGYVKNYQELYQKDTSGLLIAMTSSAGILTDIDGNVYTTVQIGNQTWTAENIRTTRYNDGTPIRFDSLQGSWGADTAGKYCYYRNTTDADSIKTFGALYNFYAVKSNKLAPAGWRVSRSSDWNILGEYLMYNGYKYDESAGIDKTAKSLATGAFWAQSDTEGSIGNDLSKNNRTGLSISPFGKRFEYGVFAGYSTYGYCWTVETYGLTDALARIFYYRDVSLNSVPVPRGYGCSVRLVKEL